MDISKKIKYFKECRNNSLIYNDYYNDDIDESIVYFESRNGKDFAGNLFRIALELSKGNYGNFKLYVYANDNAKHKIINLMKNYDLKIHEIISDSNHAVRILHKAKYIFTDSGIQTKYVKKEGQIFINTWHGTPLKYLGYDNLSERPFLGIIQRSLLLSDYLLFPNEYMCEKMLNSYMIRNLFSGKILLEGYPRNSVFIDESRRQKLRSKFNLDSKEIFVYMPTFRGKNYNDENNGLNDVNVILKDLDLNLNDNQILFAKLHPYDSSKIDFSDFTHICVFPEGWDTYDILNMADCLITDYSSVFFDFANSRNKIIIFNYDEEIYMQNRGTYFSLDELPFPKVQTIDDLICEINSPKNYDDSKFIEKFSKYENIDAVKSICETIFMNKNSSKCKILDNTKKNILIYSGNLADNDEVMLFNKLIDNIDEEEYNIFISFRYWDGEFKENPQIFYDKIQGMEIFPFNYNLMPTLREKLDYNKYIRNGGLLPVSLKELFERSYNIQYQNFRFDLIIDFSAKDLDETLIFAYSNSKKAIFKHNKHKYNKEIYNKFDYILTSDDLDELSEILRR